jgi:ABC-type polysaccharide/polyol phosphate export permease
VNSPIFDDLVSCLQKMPMITHMAYSDTKARYKRSILGPLWLTLGSAIGVVGLGVVWSVILNQSRSEFIPSLTVGLLVWQFLSSSVSESCGVFVRQGQVIRNLNLPLLIYPIQLIVKQLITFGHNLIVIIIVFLYYQIPVGFNVIYSLIGFVIVVLNLTWISIILGMIGSRFRDLEQIVQVFMPIFFFLTPVIYRVGHGGLDISILWFNPFTYFISIVRDPIIGNVVNVNNYVIACVILIVGWFFTWIVFNNNHKKLAFWI